MKRSAREGRRVSSDFYISSIAKPGIEVPHDLCVIRLWLSSQLNLFLEWYQTFKYLNLAARRDSLLSAGSGYGRKPGVYRSGAQYNMIVLGSCGEIVFVSEPGRRRYFDWLHR